MYATTGNKPPSFFYFLSGKYPAPAATAAEICIGTSQEDMFFGSLVTLVRNGLTDEDPALKGAYLNSYQVRNGMLKGVKG